MSFKVAFILFFIGLVGLVLAIYGDLPATWTLVSFTIGLGAWIVFVIWNFIDRTFSIIHHLNKSWVIQKDYKKEKAIEAKQVVQHRTSKAKKRAISRRLKLWVNTILGVRN